MSATSDNIIAKTRAAIAERAVHHRARPGAGQVAAFSSDVEKVRGQYLRALDDLTAVTGESTGSAQTSVNTLCDDAVSAAENAGAVELASVTLVGAA